MFEKLLEFANHARDLVFGWRKLGLLIAILAVLFTWLFMNTIKTATTVVVPDIPVVFAGLIAGLYLTFAAANWGVHREKRLKENGNGK